MTIPWTLTPYPLGNGVDNRLALSQIAVTANALGFGDIEIPPGVYLMDGTPEFFRVPVRIRGVGGTVDGRGSVLVSQDPTTVFFTLEQKAEVIGVTFEGGSQALRMGNAAAMTFESYVARCSFGNSTGVALDFLNQAWYTVADNIWNHGKHTGWKVRSPLAPDVDQGSFRGNKLFMSSGYAAIHCQGGGGLRILENKIIAAQQAHGIVVDHDGVVTCPPNPDGTPVFPHTSDIHICDNSIESDHGLGEYGVAVFSSAGLVKLYNILINDNQIGKFRAAMIDIHSPLIEDVSINDNVFTDVRVPGDGLICVALNGVSGAMLNGNTFKGDRDCLVRGIYKSSPLATRVLVGINRFANVAAEVV